MSSKKDSYVYAIGIEGTAIERGVFNDPESPWSFVCEMFLSF